MTSICRLSEQQSRNVWDAFYTFVVQYAIGGLHRLEIEPCFVGEKSNELSSFLVMLSCILTCGYNSAKLPVSLTNHLITNQSSDLDSVGNVPLFRCRPVSVHYWSTMVKELCYRF